MPNRLMGLSSESLMNLNGKIIFKGVAMNEETGHGQVADEQDGHRRGLSAAQAMRKDARAHDLNFLLMGRTGVGKSSTVTSSRNLA
jgi:flagellar biosynthesis GTPase FlhF